MPTLRDCLIGSWILVSQREQPTDGSPVSYPLGTAPLGMLTYTAEGFMSAQLAKAGRKALASGDWREAGDSDITAEAVSYLAYAGRFHVDEDQRQVTHAVQVPLFPNWIGKDLTRTIRLDGDHLHLSTTEPVLSAGKLVIHHIEWRRAK